MSAIRVVIADDDSLVRRALSVFLSAPDDIEIVAEATDGLQAIDATSTLRPDVVVMDVQMPHLDGISATAEITAEWPGTRVLAVTTFGSIESILPMLRAGASGYLLKDSEPDEIVAAVRGVHAGTEVLSPRVSERLVASVQAPSGAHAALPESERLSEREAQVVEQLATGKSNVEIAEAMFISEGTVKGHLSNVMTKWKARDRVQVLIRAAQAGIIRFDT